MNNNEQQLTEPFVKLYELAYGKQNIDYVFRGIHLKGVADIERAKLKHTISINPSRIDAPNDSHDKDCFNYAICRSQDLFSFFSEAEKYDGKQPISKHLLSQVNENLKLRFYDFCILPDKEYKNIIQDLSQNDIIQGFQKGVFAQYPFNENPQLDMNPRADEYLLPYEAQSLASKSTQGVRGITFFFEPTNITLENKDFSSLSYYNADRNIKVAEKVFEKNNLLIETGIVYVEGIKQLMSLSDFNNLIEDNSYVKGTWESIIQKQNSILRNSQYKVGTEIKISGKIYKDGVNSLDELLNNY
jgi:hypothetical protein